jgi:type 1 glutamine amidotransferase
VFRCVAVMIVVLVGESPLRSAEPAKQHVLFVCHSISFIHEAVVPAEKALRALGQKSNFELTCFRYTHDPAELATKKTRIYGRRAEVGRPLLEQYSEAFRAVTGESIGPEQCGRLDVKTLKKFDAVIFYTKDDPCGTAEEKQALLDFVRSGKGFVGVHSATVTHFDWPDYGKMLGGYFDAILMLDRIPIHVEARKHPATSHFPEQFEILHEVYQFKFPYNREHLQVLLSLDAKFSRAVLRQVSDGRQKIAELKKAGDTKSADKLTLSLPRLKREDGDFVVSWCKDYGKGRVFYTALGHPPEQWQDKQFLQHILGGLRWATRVDPRRD